MGCTERNGPAAGGIACRAGHEVYSMANDRGFGNYITGPRFEEDLARFMESMRADGMSETTIGEHVDNIRRCEAVLGGDVDPACATSDDAELLELRLSDRSERTRTRYLRSWNRFVLCIQGPLVDRPAFSYRLGTGFRDDLERFRRILAERGYSSSYIDSEVKFVRHCFRYLGDLTPADVDPEVLAGLDELFRREVCDNTRLRYIRALGMFVQTITGENPYREITVPDRTAHFMDYVYGCTAGRPLEEDLRLYIGILEHRGLRPNTILDKVRSVQSCIRYMEDAGMCVRPEDITPETISYLATLMDRLKETTVRVYLRNFGLFIEFLTGYNPVRDAEILWNDSELLIHRHFISDEDWSALIDHADPEEYLILMLGGTLGMRRAEMADLRFDDIRGGEITIRGKGHGPNGKEVTMILPDSVRRAIDRYMPERDRIVSLWGDRSGGRILLRRRVYPGEPMNPDAVGDAVAALAARAGVDCSTHCLRRYYCTRLHRAGVDPDTLCQMMRHERFDTTRKCYIQPDSERILNAQRALLAAIRT